MDRDQIATGDNGRMLGRQRLEGGDRPRSLNQPTSTSTLHMFRLDG